MKIYKLSIFLVIIFFCSGTIHSFADAPKTLDECLDLARKNNYQMRQLDFEREVKRLRLKSAWNRIFPQIGFNMGYSNAKTVTYAPEIESQSGEYTAGLSLTQSLFTSGANWSSIKQAQNNYQIIEYKYIETENSVSLRLKMKYYQVLRNKNLGQTRQSAVKRKENNLALIKLLYQVGNEKKTNLSQAEIDRDRAKYDLLSAENNLRISLARLNEEMGREPDAPLEIIEELSYNEYEFNEKEAFTQAFNWRPDLKQKELNIEIAELDKISARSDFLPTMALSANYTWKDTDFFPERSGWNGKFTVSFPISNGFPLYTALKEKYINVDSLKLQKEELERKITADVQEVCINLSLSDKNVEISRKSLTVAQERESLARLEYSQGRISYGEFEDIEVNLSKAETDWVESIYGYEIAKANFEYTIGKRGNK